MTVQLDAAGRLRHLISLHGLGAARITALLDRAADLRDAQRRGGAAALPPLLAGRTVTNLFFEPSTRTRTSFELAARRLGALVVNFDIAASSTSKGETLEDTLATLEAMDCDAFVVRHKENGTPERLARHARAAAVVNAGDGNHAHPTQGLLDALSIRDRLGSVEGRRVVICGDVRHSRVARSDADVFAALGAREIRLCGPQALLPDPDAFPGCTRFDDFDAALDGAEVIVMLRLQKERMAGGLVPSAREFFRFYGLDAEKLRAAKPDAIVMHPGPMNRGVEIDSAVADDPSRSVIGEQVEMGVAVRMAVLDILSRGPGRNDR